MPQSKVGHANGNKIVVDGAARSRYLVRLTVQNHGSPALTSGLRRQHRAWNQGGAKWNQLTSPRAATVGDYQPWENRERDNLLLGTTPERTSGHVALGSPSLTSGSGNTSMTCA